ncbi:MAG: 1-acyl-sn-glycerol-3-phosphate acyltransferase [Clostridia bacterium]|nr:1-acyl-sn-glycerol-3-phosphate acyltransferase [Clostridia bacterium]
MSKYNYDRPIKESKLYNFLRPLGKLVARCIFKVEYTGVENIPAEGGFILASNHIHMIDPLMIGLGIKKRQMFFMGKKELWDIPVVGWAFTKVNGFPVSRGRADSAAFKRAVDIPKKGFILGIFPEGTRSKDGKIGKAHRGVANFAAQAKCGVLPVSVYNNDNLKKRSRYTVRYGKFIPYEELGLSENATREEQIAAADRIMADITALWEEGHCE